MCGIFVEIAMLVMGIMALVTGKTRISGNKTLVGVPARIAGLILCLPIPLALGSGIILAIILVAGQQGPVDQHALQRQLQSYGLFLEWGIILGCFLAAVIIGSTWGKTPREIREASGEPEHNPFG